MAKLYKIAPRRLMTKNDLKNQYPWEVEKRKANFEDRSKNIPGYLYSSQDAVAC